MSRDYDLIDLWFDKHERLPPELSALALEMLFEQPDRLLEKHQTLVNRRKAVLDGVITLWAARMPLEAEVLAVIAIFDPLSVPFASENDCRDSTEEETIRDQPLIYLVTHFTKRTRPCPHFSQAFRLVNMHLMAAVVRLFPRVKK